jgi:hypothetical protein
MKIQNAPHADLRLVNLLKSSIIVGTITMALLMSTIAADAPVKAGDRNCDVELDHPYCNGEEGRLGMAFCTPEYPEGDCYSRDYSQRDCNENPNHSRCDGYLGRDGYIFCDIDPDADSCYDRNDDPTKYCDNYAVDESDRWYTAEFCQSICYNYQEVIGRGEPCSN